MRLQTTKKKLASGDQKQIYFLEWSKLKLQDNFQKKKNNYWFYFKKIYLLIVKKYRLLENNKFQKNTFDSNFKNVKLLPIFIDSKAISSDLQYEWCKMRSFALGIIFSHGRISNEVYCI